MNSSALQGNISNLVGSIKVDEMDMKKKKRVDVNNLSGAAKNSVLAKMEKKANDEKEKKEKIYKPLVCLDGHEGKRRGRKLGTTLEDPAELKRIEEMPSEIQSVIFDTLNAEKEWSTVKARRFLNRHALKPMKRAHVTKSGKIHFRIRDPDQYDRLRIIHVAPGVEFVLGFKGQ